MTKFHKLKTWPDVFAAVKCGMKNFEFRRNDRGFEIGDTLELREWNPVTEEFSGDYEMRHVTYIARGPAFGIPDGFCVMSLAPNGPQPTHKGENHEG